MTTKMLEEGAKAPDFALPNQDGLRRGLADFDAARLVIFFYPKDNTPGCSIEAKSLSRARKRFEALGAAPIGISGGTLKTKKKFCDALGLEIPMLTDEDFAVAKSYGVYGPKKFMGRTYQGITRATFVLGPDRRVIKVFERVKPLGHADEVLEYLKNGR